MRARGTGFINKRGWGLFSLGIPSQSRIAELQRVQANPPPKGKSASELLERSFRKQLLARIIAADVLNDDLPKLKPSGGSKLTRALRAKILKEVEESGGLLRWAQKQKGFQTQRESQFKSLTSERAKQKAAVLGLEESLKLLAARYKK